VVVDHQNVCERVHRLVDRAVRTKYDPAADVYR
jgi:hypothetical protein